MFDVSFSELILIGVIALIVIGPERLPKVARTIGHLVGRAQRYVSDVKTDIQREMDLGELTNLKEQMDDAAKSVKSSLAHASEDLRKPMEEAKDAFKDASDSVNDLIAATKASEKDADAQAGAAAQATTDAIDRAVQAAPVLTAAALAAKAQEDTAPPADSATTDDATLPLPGFAEPEHSQSEIWPPIGTPVDVAAQALPIEPIAPAVKPVPQAPAGTTGAATPASTPAKPENAPVPSATASKDASAPDTPTPLPTGTPK